MKSIYTLIIGSLITIGSMAQVNGVIVEEIDNGGIVPGRTYRIYLDCESQDVRISGIFGFENNRMYFKSTKPFFQSAFGGALANNVIRATLREKEELKYDSWFTIGYDDNYENYVSAFNLDINTFENGGNIDTDDGAYYGTPDKYQTIPDDKNRMLIAQLTTEGIITGQFTVIGRTVTGKGTWDDWKIYDLQFTAGGK